MDNGTNTMDKEANKITIEEKLKSMNLYLEEYMYRDKHMWNLSLKFFFTSLIVMFFPNLTERFEITIPKVFNSHSWIFPAFGIVLAVVYLYVSLCQAKRFEAISSTYNRISKALPEEIARERLKGKEKSILNRPSARVLLTLMFLGLIVLGIIMLIDCFNPQ